MAVLRVEADQELGPLMEEARRQRDSEMGPIIEDTGPDRALESFFLSELRPKF